MNNPSPTRKMFSHYHKVIWTSNSIVPSQNNQERGIRGKIGVSLKDKFGGSLAKIQEEHKYGRIIDGLLMAHAQEQNLPIIIPPLSKKHTYKSCRIVKTQQLETDPVMAAMRQPTMAQEDRQLGVVKSHSQRKLTKSEGRNKKQMKLELPLIFKYKRSEASSEHGRQDTEQTDLQASRMAKLKEFKQNIILKYIRTQQ